MSVELTEKVLTTINTARTADLVFRHMKEVLDSQRSLVLSKLKGDFRAGNSDQVAFQCRIAELCVLDDLENKLRSQIAAGDRAIVQTQGNGD